jgi:peptidoglycan/LPS O-acetylase OafA/YrhL
MIYPGIELLRALAAILVLVYHVIRFSSDWANLPPDASPFIFRAGWIGVDLFLVISGFVITRSALNGLDRQRLAFRPAFARRRLARIVPLYLLTSAVFLVLVNPQLLQLPRGWLFAHIGSHLLFIHNLSHHTHGSINGASWSVALEMQFYFSMLWLTPLLARIGPARLLLVALIGAGLWRFMTTLVLVPGVAVPILQFIYVTELPGVFDEFALGIALAMLARGGHGALSAALAPGSLRCAGWLLVAAVLLFVAAWGLDSFPLYSSTIMIVGWRPILAAGFTALLAAAITFPAAGARALAPLRYLGQISYGIYLWHLLVILTVLKFWPGVHGFALLSLVVPVTLALAALSWHVLEKPCLDHFKKAKPRLQPWLTPTSTT